MFCERCMATGYVPEQMTPTPEGKLLGPCCLGQQIVSAPKPEPVQATFFNRPVNLSVAFNPQQGMQLSIESAGISVNVSKSAQEVQSWLNKHISWTQGNQKSQSTPDPTKN